MKVRACPHGDQRSEVAGAATSVEQVYTRRSLNTVVWFSHGGPLTADAIGELAFEGRDIPSYIGSRVVKEGMMIVDCHTHVWSLQHWTQELVSEAGWARSKPVDLEASWESHWQAMQAVEKAIVFGLRARHVGLVVPNDFVAEYVQQHPDKLIGFASIDPNESDYMDELRRTIEDLGFRGLKLGPIYQNYHPLDERMKPVYEYCQQNHLPILIHQGTTFSRTAPLKFASPLLLEDVALSYPDLVLVIAHLGHPWIDETLVLIRKQPNFYADISALHYRPWQFYNALILALEYGVANKLLFGSDFPFTTPAESIQGLNGINHIAGESGLPRVSEEVVASILERDTLGLLGLK